MLTEYYGIFYIVILAVLFAGVTVFLSSILGPRRRSKVKSEPYECGVPTEGTQYVETPVKFYIIALLFLVFDLECVFLYPWAVIFKESIEEHLFVLIEMFIFLIVLIVGLAYIWLKGGLEWE